MRHTSDAELLAAWRGRGDREAMDELVRRHIHFVYGAARRQVGDASHADDVTQAVFMLLIHKSPRITSDAAIAVWLHRATRYASSNARRMLRRQADRDRRAARAEVQPVNETGADEYRELLPVLDEAIERLPARDRSGVILCFFRHCTFRQIGAALGISEEAARKRVSRAVERMREHFASRGVATTCAALSACLGGEAAVAAPSALVGATTNLATLSQLAGAGAAATAGSSSSLAIMKGMIHTMLLTKVKLAAAACAAIALGGAVTGAAIHQITTPSSAVVASSTALALAADPFKATVSDKLEAEFLGVNKWDAGSKGWFAIDGAKIDDPRGPFASANIRARPDTTHQAVLHIAGQDLDGGYSVRVPQATGSNLYDLTPSPDEAYLLIPFAVAGDQRTVDIELLLADGEWKTIVTAENEPGRPLGHHETEFGGIVFTHVIEGDGGGSMVYVAHEVKGPQFVVIATDAQGNEHRAGNINGGPAGNFTAMRFEYALAPDQITGLVARVRPFNKKVTAKNVTLDPSNPTKPEIVVEDQPAKR